MGRTNAAKTLISDACQSQTSLKTSDRPGQRLQLGLPVLLVRCPRHGHILAYPYLVQTLVCCTVPGGDAVRSSSPPRPALEAQQCSRIRVPVFQWISSFTSVIKPEEAIEPPLERDIESNRERPLALATRGTAPSRPTHQANLGRSPACDDRRPAACHPTGLSPQLALGANP